MSWLELDDGILDHPKFIRAVKLGGSEAVHLWLGMRAYCGQHLTDGLIPTDMLDEIRGPKDAKKRAAALTALFTVGLLEKGEDEVSMHDFLDWSSSREDVLAARERARERKARSRGGHAVTDAVTPKAVTPVVTNPSPLLSSSSPLSERDPPTPSVLAPQGADIAKPDLDSFAPDPRVISGKKKASNRKPKAEQWRRFPADFEPDDTHRAQAAKLGLNLAEQLAAIRDHEFARPKSDAAATLRTWLRNAVNFAPRAPMPFRGLPPVSPNVDHESRRALQASKRYSDFVEGK